MTIGKDGSKNRLNSKVKKWGGTLTSVLLDTQQGTAVVIISKNTKPYKFSYKSKNSTDALSKLSWSVCRLIDCDIRGILPFEKTAKDYLQLSGGSPIEHGEANEEYFQKLGLTSEASNDEVMKKYKQLARDFHPDTVQDQMLKLDIQKRFAEISSAHTEIKKARGF